MEGERVFSLLARPLVKLPEVHMLRSGPTLDTYGIGGRKRDGWTKSFGMKLRSMRRKGHFG